MTKEEALNEIRSWAIPSKKGREVLETLIPELAESEDERTKKQLIDAIKIGYSNNGISFTKEAADRYIAWLEKREEVRDAFEPNTDTNVPEKPVEWSDTNELVFKDICNHLKEEGYNGWIALLNALRNGEFQTKPEWSEEDEDMLNSCISSIEEAKENRYAYRETDGDTSYDHEISWLKSLRPSWKPSEEQIVAFSSYIKDFQEKAEAAVGGWNNFDVMIQLYEKLKKLHSKSGKDDND